MSQFTIIVLLFTVVFFIVLFRTARIIPQRQEWIVERLGKFHRTLGAGFHIIVPFIDRVAYHRSLKEDLIKIPQQNSITKDNVQLGIDGVLYIQVIDSKLSCYGITDYRQAAIQLAQTSLRSVVGKLDLDKTFEERESLNQAVVMAVDEAAQNWGVKVLRYEVKDIDVSDTVMKSMEKQMTAERNKRAEIAASEAERQSQVNRAEGEAAEIRLTAEANAAEITVTAEAQASAINKVAEALNSKGGKDAAHLEVAKDYVKEFGKLAKESNTLIIPSDVNNVASMISTAMSVIDKTKK